MVRFTARVNLLSLLPIPLVALLFPFASENIALQWFSGEQDNAHALPAFLAAVYIALTTKMRPNSYTRLVHVILFSFVVLFMVGNLLAQLASITTLSYAILLVTLATTYLLFFKLRDITTIGLICLMMALALPVWDSILEPLVVLASAVVTYLLSWIDITVLIEGNSITTPFGRILIAEGCSGIRYFLVSIILAAVVSKENNYSFFSTAVALLLGALVGLIANWIRILLLILIGYHSEMQSGLMADHEVFGWIVFAVTVVPAIYFAPQRKKNPSNDFNNPQRLSFKALFALVVLAAINYGAIVWLNRTPAQTVESASVIPSRWVERTPSREVRTLPSPSMDKLTWYYSRTNDLTIGTFSNQKTSPNDKLVPYLSQSLVISGWNFERPISITSLNLDAEFEAQVIKSSNTATRYIRLQLFNVGNQWTSSYSQAKLEQIPALLSGNNQFTYLLFWKKCTLTDCRQAIETLSNELRSITPND